MGSGFESQGAHIKKDPADSSESAGFLRSPRKRLEKLGGIDISPCSYRGPVLAELGHPDVTTDDTDSSDGFCGFGRGTLSRRGCGSCAVVWVCAPCLANWGGGGLSPFSLLLGGWCFACGAGEGCRGLACCLVAGSLGWCAVFSGSALRVSHGRSPQRSKEGRSVRVTGAPA